MNWAILGILVYIVIQLAVGILVSRRIKNDDDYFLAGRSMGPYLATFTIFATWFGAETCIGSAGIAYRYGLYASKGEPFGYAFCLIFLGVFFARKLWAQKITTLGDLFRPRFGVEVEKLVVVVQAFSSIVWAAAQVRAFGQILSSTTGYGVNEMILAATIIVAIYTIVGGLLADAYTDLIQGGTLIVGLVVLVTLMIYDQGGFISAWANLDKSKLNLIPDAGQALMLNLGWMEKLDMWLIPIVGSLTTQELMARVFASRSASVARHSTLGAAGIYLLVGFIPLMIGLMGPHYISGLEDGEQIIPTLAREFMPPLFSIMFLGALVSAILSTVDSTLLAVSTLISHNIVMPLYPELKDKQKVAVARFFVFLSSLAAYLMATHGHGVYDLVEMASSLGGSSLAVLLVASFYIKAGGRYAGLFSMIGGVLSWIIMENWSLASAPFFMSLIISIVGFALGALIDSKKEPLYPSKV